MKWHGIVLLAYPSTVIDIESPADALPLAVHPGTGHPVLDAEVRQPRPHHLQPDTRCLQQQTRLKRHLRRPVVGAGPDCLAQLQKGLKKVCLTGKKVLEKFIQVKKV